MDRQTDVLMNNSNIDSAFDADQESKNFLGWLKVNNILSEKPMPLVETGQRDVLHATLCVPNGLDFHLEDAALYHAYTATHNRGVLP